MTALLPPLKSAKRFALFAIFIAAFTGANSVQAAPVARPLIELESHIEWSAVDGAWRALRSPWVAKTAACSSTECVAGQLAVLEQHIEWKAVSPKWKSRRPGWVSAVRAATTDAQIANLLLELEANIGWGAVDQQWRALRPGWVSRLKNQ